MDDDMDEVNGAVTATIADGATLRVGDMASTTVPVTDNDVRGVTVTPTELTVDEGNSASYTVLLTSEPTADVTIAIQVSEDADIAVDQTALTFTADNWHTAQAVTVTATHDADAVADEPVTITHIVSGGDYEGVTAAEVEVTITEEDTAGVSISTDALELPEGGSQSYAVALDTEPAADVTIAITGVGGCRHCGRSNGVDVHGGQLAYSAGSNSSRDPRRRRCRRRAGDDHARCQRRRL